MIKLLLKIWRWKWVWPKEPYYKIYHDPDEYAFPRLQNKIQALVNERDSLKEKVSKQAWDLKWQQEANRRKNLELDALHFVWCDGGCAGGVHRFDHGELTEEIVVQAERNTERLRRWWASMNFRKNR